MSSLPVAVPKADKSAAPKAVAESGGRIRRRLAFVSAIPGRIWIGTASIVAGFLIWALIAQLINNQLFMVGPWAVLIRMGQLFGDGTLTSDLQISGTEFIAGMALAIVVGVPVGIAVGMSKSLKACLQPWISGFYSTPVVALSPLLILWFGIGLESKVAVIFSVAVFPIIANTQVGMTSVDPDLVEMARCFNLPLAMRIRHVYMRGSLPLILTGVRLAVGRAIVGVVVAELFGARGGLGYEVQVASQAYDTAALFATIVLLAVIGVVLSALTAWLERRSAPWLNR
jgi:ABC-type nitrate/sulfonate/bicarbonate transport system permease component